MKLPEFMRYQIHVPDDDFEDDPQETHVNAVLRHKRKHVVRGKDIFGI